MKNKNVLTKGLNAKEKGLIIKTFKDSSTIDHILNTLIDSAHELKLVKDIISIRSQISEEVKIKKLILTDRVKTLSNILLS